MDRAPYPILEYDASSEAIIEPRKVIDPLENGPDRCVICFFQDVITQLAAAGRAWVIDERRSEIGTHPVYAFELDGRRLALFHPGVGAPLAGGFLDELIALGFRHFIACGGAGVLSSTMPVGAVVVPDTALRDEGTSYHYLPPAREVRASPAAVATLQQVLDRHGVPYVTGTTWTTDAIYRETAAKVRRRREEGCLTVEMEAAAFFAVAQFRGVTFGQLLYGGDDVGGEVWDDRGWHERTTVREKLFWLAAEACLELGL